MISIENLTKIYQTPKGPLTALENVNLHINKGEIFGIIGLSGAGKSTLVRCINMLEKPTSGRVMVDGMDMTSLQGDELRQARQKIGMIFQHFNLLSSRTVKGNIEFPLEIAGISAIERKKRVRELLDIVGLADKADSYPSQLSGGQKQRVGIARALANRPQVLLSDEATSALDPQTTKAILDLLRQINKQLGVTIVLITHEMDVIKQICDRVAVIEESHIVETGNVMEIITQPQTDTARAFVRSIITSELPPALINNISHESGKLVRISFIGQSAKQPVISQMLRQFSVEANIIYGNIDQIKDVPFGHLILELIGDEEAVNNALRFLANQGLEVEVISHA